MLNAIGRYTHWLHTRWPAGRVERLPQVNEDGSTAVPGLYVVGDVAGIPLLKFSSDTGARAVATIVADPAFSARAAGEDVLDLVIIGGGVAGMAAAIEARRHKLRFEIFEASAPFATIANFPKGKPIFTYPTDMTPAGQLQFTERSAVKEGLLDELRDQAAANGIEPRIARVLRVSRQGGGLVVHVENGPEVRAHRVIVAIGRSGDYRKLNVPGEESDKVVNRLHDPAEYAGQRVLVVGGGDSALEAAIALAGAGAQATLSYRGDVFSRAKPENQQALEDLRRGGRVRVEMGSTVQRIDKDSITLVNRDGQAQAVANDVVFTLIGREAPLEFFRKSGVPIRGEWRASTWISFVLVVALCFFIYHWKKGGTFIPIHEWWVNHGLFPFGVPAWWQGLGAWFADRRTMGGVLSVSLGEPGFYYSLFYCSAVVFFGLARIQRRRTPYVKVQTWALMAIQVIPLFLLPYLVLPWLGARGGFDGGVLRSVADALFPAVDYGHGREYWRAFGLILAWPLFIFNVFTQQPLWTWLAISVVQTFVIIPLMVWRWGKGAYCGWICSCGALAETMGDAHRQKMPHGPLWNRMNMVGQAFLLFALALLVLRVVSWSMPGGTVERGYEALLHGLPVVNYSWFVDLLWSGIIGVGFYWHFSGRVWCRFACPLAALMHIYARFTRFRIFAQKKKCISCNVCTSVCHQGIDVMAFANKGEAMADPQCVRCSACVQMCPTGVLSFGRLSGDGAVMDTLPASMVQLTELTVKGQSMNDVHRRWNRRLLAAAAVIGLCGSLIGFWGVMGLSNEPEAMAGTQPGSQPATSQASSQPSSPNTPAEAGSPKSDTKVDHGALDAMFKQHVRDGLVDYLVLRRQYRELVDYLDTLAKVDPAGLAQPDRLAFYINLYNASMVRAVMERFRDGYSPADENYRVFKDKFITLGSQTLSLDDIEHQIIRKQFAEPRIHVALVCAAESCPPLLSRAYAGGDLDAVLEANMRRFVNDPQRNTIDRAGKSMALSQLFNWYGDDFGGAQGVKQYVDRYHDADVSGYTVTWREYGWKLNLTAPAEGQWVKVKADGSVYEVVKREGGRVLVDRPVQGDAVWHKSGDVEAWTPKR
jgi:thioredoxin reductase/polyferredoxin